MSKPKPPRAVSLRSLRVLVTPMPINFYQRCAILQALERHGRLDAFRQGDHNRPSHFLAITKDAETAEQLVSKAPLTLQISTSHDAPEVQSTSGKRDGALMNFEVMVHPAPEYSHFTAGLDGRYTSAWPREVMAAHQSFARQALQKVVPGGIFGEALAFWDLELPYKKSQQEGFAERIQVKQLRLGSLATLKKTKTKTEKKEKQKKQKLDAEPLPDSFKAMTEGRIDR